MAVRVRSTKIVRNPALKPVDEISDRAKRYRANKPENRPHGPKVCNYCGGESKSKTIDIDHVNGDESDSSRKNLVWACRPCNTAKGLYFKKNGLGKIVSKNNPARHLSHKALLQAYGHHIRVIRGQLEGDAGKSLEFIRATPPSIRSEYTSRGWNMRKQIYGPSGRGGNSSDVPF